MKSAPGAWQARARAGASDSVKVRLVVTVAARPPPPPPRLHQQIGVRLLPIICFTPQLFLLIFCKKFCYYLLLLRQAQMLIIAIIRIRLLQLLIYALIICIISFIEIIVNYCTLFIWNLALYDIIYDIM